MTVLDWQALAARPLDRRVVVAIGVFDGVHGGHRTLLQRVVAHGGGAPAVLTFDPLPGSVLFGGSGRLILSRRQKERKLARLGVRYLIVVDFSRSFSQITGEAFISQMLRRAAVRGVVVGQDFRCGRHRDTDTRELSRLLRSRGVDTDVVALVRRTDMVAEHGYDGAKVSSSGIRQAIDSGDLGMVRSLLGHDYELDVEGVTPGRTDDGLVFPASSLTQLLPGPGRYAGYARGASGSTAVRITVRPDRVVVSGTDGPAAGTAGFAGIGFVRRES